MVLSPLSLCFSDQVCSVPFSAWLPSAMAAPTPVSALVHSSTLVTAGVYLLLRFLPSSVLLLSYIGIFTVLFSGVSALLEMDIKKVVALSTLRQLGLIMTCLGIGLKGLVFFHLLMHASIKALLFLTVGIIIHCSYGSQELRNIASFGTSNILCSTCFLLSRFSLFGLCFLSGSASKDLLLIALYNRGFSYFLILFFYLGIATTFGYCFRLIWSVISYATSKCSFSLFSPSISQLSVCLLPLLFLAIFEGHTTGSLSPPRFRVT